MNIPHKEEFFRLPAEKREIYWDLYQGVLRRPGRLASTSSSTPSSGAPSGSPRAGPSLLPFKLMVPALALMALIMVCLHSGACSPCPGGSSGARSEML
ncbi:MAG: hypothetical protein M0C28_02010 [Candidatus Moduliflexus flocculans]|nr:hypothetical protein [Candidatus Moduliflexus flocculans]